MGIWRLAVAGLLPLSIITHIATRTPVSKPFPRPQARTLARRPSASPAPIARRSHSPRPKSPSGTRFARLSATLGVAGRWFARPAPEPPRMAGGLSFWRAVLAGRSPERLHAAGDRAGKDAL